jgi:ubiquinone/menaquinone biosynthesis C-methylase UbiE
MSGEEAAENARHVYCGRRAMKSIKGKHNYKKDREVKSKGISLNEMSGYYDALTPAEKSRLRQKQIELAEIKEGETILEVGCGTGVMSVLARLKTGNRGKVHGIDIAEKMIKQARKKAEKLGLDIDFKVASIDRLPFPDNYFDVVIASMMFHHLPVIIKEAGLKEIYRVSKGDGRLLLSDFSTPGILAAPLMFLLLIWLRSTRYHLLGKLPALIRKAGFKNINIARKAAFIKHYLIRK